MHSLGDADSMIAQGIRMILEFAAPIGIAGFLGYHIDKWLDSAPFVMLFMCLLGFAAGIMNVYRSAMGYTGGVGFKKTSEEEEDEEDNG